MIDSSVAYDKFNIGKLIENWVDSNSFKKKNKNIPLSTAIYQELLSILKANGEKNIICFRLVVNSEIKPDSFTQMRLAIIRLYFNHGKNYPYFLAGFIGIILIPIIINRPIIISELLTLILLFGFSYIVWFLILILSFFIGAILIAALKNCTLVRHPHLLYLSQVYSEDGFPTSRIKVIFKDNEGYYGKSNNYRVELVINEGCHYDQVVTQKELAAILKTIQYAQTVHFV
jgi:hypothetical protein